MRVCVCECVRVTCACECNLAVLMELVDAALRLGLLTAAMCVRVESATFAGPLSSSLYFSRVGIFTIITA